ncbi:MAG: DUF2493 domain-containing protein [Niveispirillum sp.]|uniref:DUF2493 domain-containing protein n=1 Tax=Niveispirillum sp. TaxID=1917217 RepID=UPI00403627E1
MSASPPLPPGPKVAFTGGGECNDVDRIWAALDKVHVKHPDMVLLHGGSPKGAERIAACWAENRRVPPRSSLNPTGPATKGGTLPSQRPDAGNASHRPHRLSRFRHHPEPRRQGTQDGRASMAFRDNIIILLKPRPLLLAKRLFKKLYMCLDYLRYQINYSEIILDILFYNLYYTSQFFYY